MPVRALVVDDSPSMRAIISNTLTQSGEIEVVGTADSPVIARQMIKDLNPDVITLDIEMPNMNGLDFLDKIMRLRPTPVVMVSTLTQRNADATVRALELGAVDCYAKPQGSFAKQKDPGELCRIVLNAARTRVSRRIAPATTTRVPDFRCRSDALIAVGSSTGGVEALITLLQSWPAKCPPTVITQHMPAMFTKSFAERLDRLCAAHVAEAKHGEPLEQGRVYLAPGGENHLEVHGGSLPRCRLVPDGLVNGHRPSVDRLFFSVERTIGKSAVGIILTGMGADGARGLKAMHDAGSATFGQDEATCVVYGMPAAAFRMGAVDAQLPIERIGPRALQECRA